MGRDLRILPAAEIRAGGGLLTPRGFTRYKLLMRFSRFGSYNLKTCNIQP